MRKPMFAMAVAGLALAAGMFLSVANAAPQTDPKKPDTKKPAGKDDKKPTTKEKYVTTKSGLKYYDIKVGTGATPKVTDTVTVNYVGTLTNGKKFDASADHGGPASFPLNRVIKGWTEGVSTMKVGGKRKLICPPDLAYGAQSPSPDIPPNSTLVFEVELLKIGQ